MVLSRVYFGKFSKLLQTNKIGLVVFDVSKAGGIDRRAVIVVYILWEGRPDTYNRKAGRNDLL